MIEPADDPFAFAEKLLAILDRGSFTSTYKYAVLLGLLDLALEATARDGAPPTSVTTRQLAEKVVELYWPHTRDFGIGDVLAVLAQNSDRQAALISDIAKFRQAVGAKASWTLFRARSDVAPKLWQRLLDAVEWKLVEMPLPRLQTLGGSSIRFLYEIGWNADIKRSLFRSGSVSNVIAFQRGAATHLVRLAGLVRPLIHREWAACVARFNGLPSARLEQFLFGHPDRSSLDAVRQPLADLQHGECFYCGTSISESAEVDHFVPWSRHPNDAIENLVVAHGKCNNSKSDHLAACDHLDRWLTRNSSFGPELSAVGSSLKWESDAPMSIAVARGIYSRLPQDHRLWAARPDVFTQIMHAEVDALFAAV